MSKPLIIITGASSGIGAATARVFSNAGYPVALMARNLAKMEALKLPHSLCLAVDMTNPQAVKEAIKEAEQALGPVDCIINNAGYAQLGDFVDISDEDQHTMVDLNIKGLMHGIKSVLPGMRERQSGTIINVSSIADRNARPALATYAATKAAVKSLSESLRVANAKYGIRVCNLAPAKIRTPMLNAAGLSQGEIIEVEDFVKAVLWVYQQPNNICVRDMVFAPTRYEA